MLLQIHQEKKVIPLSPALLLSLSAIALLLIGFGLGHHQDEYFYLFSVLHYPTGELMKLEVGLASGIFPEGYGIFPEGFFAAKIGLVVILRFLVQLLGSGLWSLLMIQFIFALMLIGFVVVSYVLLREIFEKREALYISVVLMFLPISVYLDHKVLSEVPSLLFTALGCWAFLGSFRSPNRWRSAGFIVLAAIGLLLGVLCRFTSFLFFAGLVLGLFVLRNGLYSWTKVFIRASLVSVCLIIMMFAFYKLIGLSYQGLIAITMGVVERRESLGVKLYELMMSVQLFLPSLVLAIWPPWSSRTRLALVWMGVCTLPFVFGLRHFEPRYFYTALVPLSILAYLGLQRFTAILSRYRISWVFLLVTLVLGNRLFFARLVPYEIDQNQYLKIMTGLIHRYPSATYLIPWLSDYSFLRFTFPKQDIRLSWSKGRSEGEEIFPNEAFRHWVGEKNYVDSLELLNQLPRPWIYVGWTYNPAVINLKERLQWFGIDYLKEIEQQEGLQDHIALSWIWSNPALRLKQIAQVGLYRAFEIQQEHEASLSSVEGH